MCSTIVGAVEKVEQVKEGHLALPTSQQPSPLFAYGQNIVDKGNTQFESYIDYHFGKGDDYVDILPGVLYGVSDRFSLFLNVPVTPLYHSGCNRSSGIEDIFIQGEYAAYYKDKPRTTTMVTLVGALYMPTGSATKKPHTGAGAPSFYLGTTISYLSVDWYFFAAPGAFLNTASLGTHFGNSFLYQGGLGHIIASKADTYIFTGILELFGILSGKDRINGVIDPNTGSNLPYVGPTLWFSTQKIFLQFGILFPVSQRLNGIQNKQTALFAFDFGYKFN